MGNLPKIQTSFGIHLFTFQNRKFACEKNNKSLAFLQKRAILSIES